MTVVEVKVGGGIRVCEGFEERQMRPAGLALQWARTLNGVPLLDFCKLASSHSPGSIAVASAAGVEQKAPAFPEVTFSCSLTEL